jgi:hypothetical protein
LCETNDKKIIGIATNIIFNDYIVSPTKIKTYDPTIYETKNVNDNLGNIEIFENGKKLDYEFITLEPCIYSLCKDKGYQEVGRFLLDNICSYYKKKGYEKIYLVPESNKHRNKLLNTNVDSQLFKDSLSGYKHDQEFLIDYYKKNDFNISNNYYSCSLVTLDGSNKVNVLFYNIMYKEL